MHYGRQQQQDDSKVDRSSVKHGSSLSSVHDVDRVDKLTNDYDGDSDHAEEGDDEYFAFLDAWLADSLEAVQSLQKVATQNRLSSCVADSPLRWDSARRLDAVQERITSTDEFSLVPEAQFMLTAENINLSKEIEHTLIKPRKKLHRQRSMSEGKIKVEIEQASMVKSRKSPQQPSLASTGPQKDMSANADLAEMANPRACPRTPCTPCDRADCLASQTAGVLDSPALPCKKLRRQKSMSEGEINDEQQMEQIKWV